MKNSCVLSVVVCTYNRKDLLRNCLFSLADQSLGKSHYEVLIIDNNSSDATQVVIQHFLDAYGNISSYIEHKQGLSHARNRGWQVAKGRFVAYIDDDAIADKDWCSNILKAFVSIKPMPVAVGGPIYPYYDSKKPEWFLDEFEIRQWGEKAHYLEGPDAKFGFSGSNMAFQRQTLVSFNGFSSEFGMIGNKMRFGEDTQLFIRVFQHSPYFWYDPEIVVRHWTPKRNMKIRYNYIRSKMGGESGFCIYNAEKQIPVIWCILRIGYIFILLCCDALKYVYDIVCSKEHWRTSMIRFTQKSGEKCGIIDALIAKVLSK